MAIAVGEQAPRVIGVPPGRPRALIFYEADCPTTQLVAPALARLGPAYPGAVVGVGQDPQADLDVFAETFAWGFPQVPDLAPYVASDAYGISTAPTLIVIDGEDRVADVVEAWDREGMNRASATLARLLDADPAVLSTPQDGLPAFKPG
ncbi:MAG: peroxiredoxin family protein [Planctomycetaceae bacterium]